MKNTILFVLLFLTTICNAKFLEGTIVFKDGHSETGFIKSFLEDKFFDYTMFKKFEQEFNLDDKTIKFKKSKDDSIILYSIDEINELQIKNGTLIEIYKPLQLKTINKNGEIIDKKIKVWLPLVKRGSINVYGFEYFYRELKGSFPEHGFMFYFQNSTSDFAISPFEKISMFGNKSNSKIYGTFYKYLFESCPEYYTKHLPEITKYVDYTYTKEEKKELSRNYGKRYTEYNKKKDRNIIDAFEFDNFETNNFMKSFDSECN